MWPFLRQLWQFVSPRRSRLGWGVVAGAVSAVGSAGVLLALNLVLDAIFPTEGAAMLGKLERLPGFLRDPLVSGMEAIRIDARSTWLMWFIAGVPLAMLMRGLGTYFNIYCMHWLGAFVVHDLRVRLFAQLQRLSMDYFSKARTGDLLSRMTTDTQAIHLAVSTGFATLGRDPAVVVCLVAYLVLMQPRLTFVSLVIFPLIVVPVVQFGRKVRRSWKTAQAQTAELTSLMQENFVSARVVKAYNAEARVTERFAATSRSIASQLMRLFRASELPGPLIESFGAVGVSLLLYYVSSLGPGQRPTAGDFTAFVGALFSLYAPLKGLSRLWGFLEQGRAAGERLFPILDLQPDIVDPPDPQPVDGRGAVIEFDRVTFGYGDKPALRDFQLRVEPGQFVALVGASGSGKTSVTNLLLRFYDPQSGAVRIGGRDLREVRVKELRDQIAIVTQETILFNDTVRNNLRMGRWEATDAEIETAARHARAHEFILAKPGGYDAVIGERGSALSGGQRQRLAIARALLKNAPILVLDEATSALDSESERAVQAALDDLTKGCTTICIAHRLSTIQRADWIVVMDQGRIIESGRHADLLARGGTYRRLHDLQFAD